MKRLKKGHLLRGAEQKCGKKGIGSVGSEDDGRIFTVHTQPRKVPGT